ncbi:MAG: 50S ribosomal protein L23 [candidate division WOR-3 bacterium]
MKHPAEVLIRPVITEKSTRLAAEANQYVFEVAADATKVDVAAAVRALYGVKVIQVRIAWVKPKPKRLGWTRRVGYTTPWKKAIVRLAPGHQITDFAV